MTVSKKTLDKFIEVYRKFWKTEETVYLKCIGDYCRTLENQTDYIISWVSFSEIVGSYTKYNATNETIYKAIELLKIEIEKEKQSESKPKYERMTDRDIAVTLNNNECEDITRFLRYAQRLWELENKIEQGKLVFREGNNEQI